MSEWDKLVKKAKEQLEEKAFVVESKRALDQQASLRVIEVLRKHNGKTQYKVVEETPQDGWY